MSNAPPPPVEMQNAYAYGPPSRTSAAAVVSLVTGILGCLVVTPFVAIVSGIVGIRATRDLAVRGRAMAVAGLILGLLWIFGAIASTTVGVVFWRNSEPPAVVARQFTADLVAGDYPAALAKSSGLTEANLREIHDGLAPWGANTDITLGDRHANKPLNGPTRWELIGTADFATGGTKRVEYVIDAKPNGGFQVVGVHFK